MLVVERFKMHTTHRYKHRKNIAAVWEHKCSGALVRVRLLLCLWTFGNTIVDRSRILSR